MGCPVGIGPEIILRHALRTDSTPPFTPVILGDLGVLTRCAAELSLSVALSPWLPGTPLPTAALPVIELSRLPRDLPWGSPTPATATAMAHYIKEGVGLARDGILDAIATCPISKAALQAAGYPYPGHTEMLAALTGAAEVAMMMVGSRLRVTLVTIHCPLGEVPARLTTEAVLRLIRMTHGSLRRDFAMAQPHLAVAGLNPHAGENGLFGSEEGTIIEPAVQQARGEGIAVEGPFPPDTVFFKAAAGAYDAVVCMYHDQGLIPFKLLHFSDGVNVTLGLPIVRTSVDHGTAYDIAGRGRADASSLAAAVNLAAVISANRKRFDHRP
ncbi:4-hydroxythreonine-4-phosphate dehydrogenase [Desulfoprunum benzoelyticum]|uniref:4-hydroxythreonine-4-phosphate dehydrogenase n=1 Tax=Desulfoprunum benzoelyticum TaxID=1506996 RepID=A0A840V597_9BACT|nr:4-hydroxythreonine-4-phosphate dehydrogenase PdxA [Desulfoprunum benzoelyticum]MBB5348919.1 4-hydroxythreonine-4-phosphate dehydrogenase [Desulfoprunum benzoelyticum]